VKTKPATNKAEYMLKKQSDNRKGKKNLKPSKETQKFAMYIAMVVRNTMEDFHCKHLSNEQMKELNPIIRNAICTALYAFENYDENVGAKKFVDFNGLCCTIQKS
jgi:hypothetical protein